MTSSSRPDKGSKKSGKPSGAPKKSWSPRALGALLVLGLCAVGALTWYLLQEHEKNLAARKKAQTYAIATEAQGTLSEALSNMVSCLSGVQAQAPLAKDFEKRLAQGSEGKYASAGRQIKEQCTPAFRKALAQIGAKLDIAAWRNLQDSGNVFAEQADRYAATLAAHAAVDQADHRIAIAAQAWSDSEGKTEAALRFESFMICALPDARARVDVNTFFKWTAVNCTQNGTYAERLRTECLPKLDVRDEHPTDEEYTVLETIRHAKVPNTNGKMSVARYMMFACSERTRREWVDTDGKPLIGAFSTLSASREAFVENVSRLKPPPPEP